MKYYHFLMYVGDIPCKVVTVPKLEWTKEGIYNEETGVRTNPTFDTVDISKSEFAIPYMDITADDIYLLEVSRGFSSENIVNTFKHYFTYSDELQRDIYPVKLVDLETGAYAVAKGSQYSGSLSPWEFFTPAGNSLGESTWIGLNQIYIHSTWANAGYCINMTERQNTVVEDPVFRFSGNICTGAGAVNNFLLLSTDYDEPWSPKKVPEDSEEYYSLPCEIYDNQTNVKLMDYNFTFPKLKYYDVGFLKRSDYGFITWHTGGITGQGWITNRFYSSEDLPQIFTNPLQFSNISNEAPPYMMNNFLNIWADHPELKIVTKQDPGRYITMTADGEHYFIDGEQITTDRQKLISLTSNVYGKSWRMLSLNNVNAQGVIDDTAYINQWAYQGTANAGYALEMLTYVYVLENNIGSINMLFRKWLMGLSVDIMEPEPPEVTPDPNEPGGTTGGGGGGGNFDGTSDPVVSPEIPSLEVSDAGFVKLFSPTKSQLNSLANFLWSGNVGDTLKKLFANPMDVIINLGILPFTVPTTGQATIKVGFLDTDITMDVVTNQYITIDCGNLTIDEYWGSALDYSPYTKISVVLPYIGTRDLNVDEIMKTTLNVKYRIDMLSGACVAFISANGTVLYQFSGNVMSQIPITAVDYKTVVNSVVSTATAAAAAVASGGLSAPFTAAMGVNAVATTANNVMNSKPHINRAGSIGGNAGYMAIQKPYLIIERPRQALPSRYNTFVGYPANITKQLKNVSGFTTVSDIHLENIPATESELNQIMTALKEGVIL